jgi:hypothetical protein
MQIARAFKEIARWIATDYCKIAVSPSLAKGSGGCKIESYSQLLLKVH